MTMNATTKSKSVTFASPSNLEEIYTIRNRFDIPLKEWRQTWYKYYELVQLQDDAFAVADQYESELDIEHEDEEDYQEEAYEEEADEEEDDDISIVLPTFTNTIVRNTDDIPLVVEDKKKTKKISSDHQLEPLRGLEVYTRLGKERTWKRRREAIHAVLHEQQLQQQEGIFDSDSIAIVYSDYTSTCTEKARQVGIMDEQLVISSNNNVVVPTPLSVTRKVMTTTKQQVQQQRQQPRQVQHASLSSPSQTTLPIRVVVEKGGACDNKEEKIKKGKVPKNIFQRFKFTTKKQHHRRSNSNATDITTISISNDEEDYENSLHEEEEEGQLLLWEC